MARCYWFPLWLDLEFKGLPVTGHVEVDYEYEPPDRSVGFHGSIEVVGVSRFGTPIRRLEKWLLAKHREWLEDQAVYDWMNRDG